MRARLATFAVAALMFLHLAAAAAPAGVDDPRLREVVYDPKAIITVPVKRGVVTLVQLDPDEAITDVASGLGSDCAKPEAPWCIAAQAGGHSLFVKAKSAALAANNLAVVTDRRTYSFSFVVLADGNSTQPIHRLVIRPPVVRTARAAPPIGLSAAPLAVDEPGPANPPAARLHAGPRVLNSSYSIAEGEHADDIVPTLVFDDGRFTYFRFPGNREVPAVFHVLGDGSETLVNSRMEDDLLVVDRVSRRLMLRAGGAAVGVWNDAFDLEGMPPVDGSTIPGLARALKSDAGSRGTAARAGAAR